MPLLVALHTWSGSYQSKEPQYAGWCQQAGWAFVYPNFRGSNKTAQRWDPTWWSPISLALSIMWLGKADRLPPLDINHGIDDGRSGSVPFTHSVHAWNAAVGEHAKIDYRVFRRFYETAKGATGTSRHESCCARQAIRSQPTDLPSPRRGTSA